MAILTADELRASVPRGAPAIDASEFDDTWVDDAIAEHDNGFRIYCGDIPDSATATETIEVGSTSSRLILEFGRIISVTSVTIDGSTLDASRYRPVGGSIFGVDREFYAGTTVVVVYSHGFGSPSDLKRSCAWFVAKAAAADRAGAGREVRASGPEFTSYASPGDMRPTGWTEVDTIWNRYRASYNSVLIA